MSTGEKDRRPAPLSENALRQLIRTALSRGYIRETPHAEFDHPERNISIEDVIYGLERPGWIIVGNPDYDEEHQSQEYLIATRDIEGEELHIKVAAFPHEKRITIITRW